MELNQTPVRTSKNYNINSIKIKSEFLDISNENLIKNNENKEQNANKFDNFTVNSNQDFYVSKDVDREIENYLNDEIKCELISKSNFELNLGIYKNSIEPLILTFNFNKNHNKLIDIININIQENVNSQIIVKYLSDENNVYYHNQLLKINLEKDSDAEIILLYDISKNSENYVSIESSVKKNAKLNLNIVDFSCKNSIFNYNTKLIGENAVSNINSLYVGSNDSVIDLNYLSRIFAPNSKTNIEVIGTLEDSARKHFKGTIDFKKGCKKSVGSENEFCMLLSKNAKSKALPMLLCTEEDVDGKHSASVGKVDNKQLFYIMSRGLTYTEALKLIVKAKFNSILSNIFDEDLKKYILDKIDKEIK